MTGTNLWPAPSLAGSFTRAYYNIALYMVTNIGLSVVTGLLGLLATGRESFGALGSFVAGRPSILAAVHTIDHNLFPVIPSAGLDRTWMIMVVSNALVALGAACFLFNRREVPYGAD
ncbi:MAG: hypothetical protein ABI837_01920 [Acidobacteriota bacterium]